MAWPPRRESWPASRPPASSSFPNTTTLPSAKRRREPALAGSCPSTTWNRFDGCSGSDSRQPAPRRLIDPRLTPGERQPARPTMKNNKQQTQTKPTMASTPQNKRTTMRTTKLVPRRFRILSLLAAASCALAAPAHSAVVTSAADDGTPGTLRSAMAAAAPGDSITFDPSLTGQTITLTGGQLLIDKDLIITGPGANQLAISGNNAGRVFYVDNGVTATIEGLTVRDGRAQHDTAGGGIYNRGTLTVNNCTFSGNSA